MPRSSSRRGKQTGPSGVSKRGVVCQNRCVDAVYTRRALVKFFVADSAGLAFAPSARTLPMKRRQVKSMTNENLYCG